MSDLGDMTDTELAGLARAVEAEQESRRLDERVHEINVTALTKADVHRGQAWEQPTSAASAYPKGWTLTHDGKTWVSLIDGNVWEPSVTGWREVTDDEPPQWIQPMGAHDSYGQGDKVAYDGQVWESTVPHNVWEPGTAGLWNRIEPEPDDDDGDGDEEPEQPEIPEWAQGVDYATGDTVTHDGTTYRCVTGHTSQTGWHPPAVPALWQPIEEEDEAP